MTRRIILVSALIALARPLAAEDIKLPTLKVGSTIYSNVTVTTVTATEIYFKHSGGMSNTRLRYLEPAMRQRFHYQPEIAAEIERQQYSSSSAYSPPPWSRPPAASAAADVPTATAATGQGNLFADPVSDASPVNKPAPDINVEKWFSDKPPPTTGKCVIILFWSSSSEACRRAIPGLNDLQKKYADNLVVIGITSETERELSQTGDLKVDFYYGSDTKSVTRQAVGIASVPSVLVVDAKGIVRYQGHPAAIKEDALESCFAR